MICSDETTFRRRSGELVGWLVDWGYKEEFVGEQLARASNLDKTELFSQEGRLSAKKKDHIPLIVTFHPALNELRDVEPSSIDHNYLNNQSSGFSFKE